MMDKLVAIAIDGQSTNVLIVPEHWNNGQSGFENADVYLVMNAADEQTLATLCFTEDKTNWEISGDLDIAAEHELVDFIKSQSPLTAL